MLGEDEEAEEDEDQPQPEAEGEPHEVHEEEPPPGKEEQQGNPGPQTRLKLKRTPKLMTKLKRKTSSLQTGVCLSMNRSGRLLLTNRLVGHKKVMWNN